MSDVVGSNPDLGGRVGSTNWAGCALLSEMGIAWQHTVLEAICKRRRFRRRCS